MTSSPLVPLDPDTPLSALPPMRPGAVTGVWLAGVSRPTRLRWRGGAGGGQLFLSGDLPFLLRRCTAVVLGTAAAPRAAAALRILLPELLARS